MNDASESREFNGIQLVSSVCRHLTSSLQFFFQHRLNRFFPLFFVLILRCSYFQFSHFSHFIVLLLWFEAVSRLRLSRSLSWTESVSLFQYWNVFSDSTSTLNWCSIFFCLYLSALSCCYHLLLLYCWCFCFPQAKWLKLLFGINSKTNEIK